MSTRHAYSYNSYVLVFLCGMSFFTFSAFFICETLDLFRLGNPGCIISLELILDALGKNGRICCGHYFYVCVLRRSQLIHPQKKGLTFYLRSTGDLQLNVASVPRKHLQMLDPVCLVQHKPVRAMTEF